MAQNTFVEINEKKYVALASLYKLTYDRQRTYDVGLTGLSIVQEDGFLVVSNLVTQFQRGVATIFGLTLSQEA